MSLQYRMKNVTQMHKNNKNEEFSSSATVIRFFFHLFYFIPMVFWFDLFCGNAYTLYSHRMCMNVD